MSTTIRRTSIFFFAFLLSLCLATGVAFGQNTAITLSPAAPLVNFPATAVGSNAVAQNVVLSINNDLTISGITVPISQGGVQEFVVGSVPDCAINGATVITAGSTCTVPVTFQPGYPGLRQAPLVVQSSQGTFHFGLGGVGHAPQVVLVPGLITTVAGTGSAGYSGDGGSAERAQLYIPAGVALDTLGNLYFTDYGNSVVRKVDAMTGIISTVAGNGTKGYAGDGGPATSAELQYPVGITIDAADNLYIADMFNGAIREVDAATGVIRTVAGNGITGYAGDGGPATSAKLNFPGGVTLDAAGNLYIAEHGSGVIREVDAVTGIISTVAGHGTTVYASRGGDTTILWLNDPTGIAVDLAGNFYIADWLADFTYKVDATTGNVTYLPIPGAEVALTPAGNLYVTAQDKHIYEVDAATGLITSIAGNGMQGHSGDGGPATAASFSGPEGIARDAAGNQYIADDANVIRKVSAEGALILSGQIQTVILSNTGDAPLLISAITASGNFAVDAGTTCSLSTPVAAGDSCRIGVIQTAGGPQTGTLTITDNALNITGATQQVQLTGTGGQPTVATPTLSPAPGVYSGPVAVTLSDATAGATIYYTLDGSTPTIASTRYTGIIMLAYGTSILRAIAAAPGYIPSQKTTGTYTIDLPPAAPPAFSPAPGVYTTAETVSLSDATPGATIYYTTDGSAPTLESAQYSGPITLSHTTTINAIAGAPGFTLSPVVSGTYMNMGGPAVASGTLPIDFPVTPVGSQSAPQTVLIPITKSLAISSISVLPSLAACGKSLDS